MARQEYLYQQTPAADTPGKSHSRADWVRQGWFLLLALVLLAELFTPFLVWPLRLPRIILGVVEIALAMTVFATFIYMLKEDRVPRAVLLIIGLSLVWSLSPMIEGQSLAATAWGWWGMFKYPFLALFAYLVQGWPPDFARRFFRFCIGLLIFQIIVQLIMFALGFPIGDSLAGTFGLKGVMQFTMLVFFIVSLGLGHWLATYERKTLLLILALGLLGSTLNATKFYLIGVGILAAATLLIHLIRGGQIRQLFIYIVLIAGAAAVFIPIYNSYLVNAMGLKPLQEYLNLETAGNYIFTDGSGNGDLTYNIGRGLAITYGWQQIQRDLTTTLFGFGIGTRSQSELLGIRGSVLQEDVYGVGVTTMGTWIQEIGVVGMLVFMTICLWMATKMFQYARRVVDPYRATLAYGLMLFTLFWPLWQWYHKAWTAGVMMTLYWVAIGYIFNQIYATGRRRRVGRRIGRLS
ncbi:MAG TPA: hypothetical protein PK205_00260 [Promineifilum sp.]|nr:hypothetical protein [Promineifilum sp.]HRO91208.1 hypothetical protein [Promineifilum sp.]HRQ11727.1 hypothetical protein [Promineifilum sp.]